MNNQPQWGGFGSGAGEMYANATSVATAAPDVRAAFLNKMYLTLTAGVGISMATSIALAKSAATNENHILWSMVGGKSFLILLLAYMALSFGAHAVSRIRGINLLVFAGFTAFTGFVIAPLFLAALLKTQSFVIVWQALGLTTLAFGSLTGYVMISGRDFSFMRGFLFVGFFVLLGFMILGFFFNSWGFHMGVTCAGLLLFAGFVLYDTSVVMHHMGPDEWVGGALRLFVDFINMFVRVLSILLNRR